MATIQQPTITVRAGRMSVDTSAGSVRVYPFISRATQTANAQRIQRIVAELEATVLEGWFADTRNREMAD